MSIEGATIGFAAPIVVVSGVYGANGLGYGVILGALTGLTIGSALCIVAPPHSHFCNFIDTTAQYIVFGGAVGFSIGAIIGAASIFTNPKLLPICLATMLIGAAVAEPISEGAQDMPYMGDMHSTELDFM